jgi:hypothetical protein
LGGCRLDEVIDVIAADLDAGLPVAVGFEAPLFVPMSPYEAGASPQWEVR